MLDADLIIRNADVVWTCAGPAPRLGSRQRKAGPIAGGALAAMKGRIVFIGPTEICDRSARPLSDAEVIDAAGCSVLPGFVDAHTHVVYAGDRYHELRRRLQGITYAQIAAEGGGILSTVDATRQASEDALIGETRSRLDVMLRSGTTTCEAKSGYGLALDAELKMLRVMKRLQEEHPIDLVPTFLGAHEIPPEYRPRRREYVDLVIDEMIPAVVREGLAEWCDVFCEEGVYTPDEATLILQAGQKAGLQSRIHADEFGASGGSFVAAHVRARSADHLVYANAEAARALKNAGVVATLLPTAALYLKLGRFAPARALIDTGVAVALGSDVNPGGGLSASMPFAMTLACFGMEMTLEEAIVGATLNAAYAIDRDRMVGSLEPGKAMDAVIIRGDAANLLRLGDNPIMMVIKNGKPLVRNC